MADLGTLPDSPRDLGWSLRVAIHAMDFFAMKGTFDPKCVGKSASEGGPQPVDGVEFPRPSKQSPWRDRVG